MNSNALWDEFVAKTYAGGIHENIRRELKITFYTGLMELISGIGALGDRLERIGVEAEESMAIFEKWSLEIAGRTGAARASFDAWESAIYPKGMSEAKRPHIENAFFVAMQMGFEASNSLVGPSQEEDVFSAQRLVQFRDDIAIELGKLVEE